MECWEKIPFCLDTLKKRDQSEILLQSLRKSEQNFKKLGFTQGIVLSQSLDEMDIFRQQDQLMSQREQSILNLKQAEESLFSLLTGTSQRWTALQNQLAYIDRKMKQLLVQDDKTMFNKEKLLQELSRMRNQFEFLMEEQTRMQVQCQQLQKELQIGEFVIKTGQQHFISYNQLKKKCNLELQDHLGNVRVYCRIRPSFGDTPKITYKVNDNILEIQRNLKSTQSANRQSKFFYVFEKIFEESTTQQLIFEEVQDIIQAAVDGKDVCVFAYGQTGSGKTFTMKGQDTDPSLRGFIPRSLQLIFQQTAAFHMEGVKTMVEVSIIEIYNEKVKDLVDNRICDLKDLKFLSIQNVAEGLTILAGAMKARATAETKCNPQSSRSHLIFTITLQVQIKNKQRRSSLVLVDLAGSERPSQSQVHGQRYKQATKINSSLSELGKVIRAMKEDQPPVFRNSKLTMALQPYLVGNGKAVMFVNVSPAQKDEQMTVQALNFAEGVREVKVGTKKR